MIGINRESDRSYNNFKMQLSRNRASYKNSLFKYLYLPAHKFRCPLQLSWMMLCQRCKYLNLLKQVPSEYGQEITK